MHPTDLRKKPVPNLKPALCHVAVLWAFMLCSSLPAGAQPPSLQAAIEPAAVLPGDVLLVTVKATPDPISSGTCIWHDQNVPLHISGNGSTGFALLGIPSEAPAGTGRVRIEAIGSNATPVTADAAFTIRAKEFPLQRLTLPESQVTLSKKNLARHQREKEQIETALAQMHLEKLWQHPFQAPVPGAVISPFGVRRLINDKPRSSHSGVDLRAAAGEPVHACSDGQVILTGNHFFAGNSIYVDHGMGIVSMYFHLSKVSVTPGDHVAAGQVLGLAGSTGRSTGAHLHWGVRVNDCKVNPLSLIQVSALAP